MKIKPFNFSKLIFVLVFLFITGETLIQRFIQNSYPLFWLDEPLELFVAVHTPFTPPFTIALQKIISSMPLFYIEYWLYLKLLYHIFPLNELMRHLETFLRLPLTLYSIITIASLTIMTWRLSRSYIFAGGTTLILFTINHLSSHLGAELRFHSAGFAHCALSWCCFSLFLTSENNSRRIRYLLFGLWILTAILAGASHIYSTYSLFLQIFIFLLASWNYLPCISLSPVKPSVKIFGFLILLAGACAEGLYFLLYSVKPYPRDALLTNLQAVQKSFTLLSTYIFIPGLWLWISLFVLLSLLTFLKTPQWKDRFKIIFLFFLGLGQIFLILLLSWKYLKWNWGPNPWLPRYTTAGLIPFVFFLSYFARNWISPKWENNIAPGVAAVTLIIFLFNPSLKYSYYGHDHHKPYGDERWLKLRQNILDINAYGQVHYVLGLKPSLNPLEQYDVHGNPVDIYWQLYSGGPFSMTPLDKVDPFGGRILLPCEARKTLPLAIIEGVTYALDFCDKDQAHLRIVK